MICLNVRLSNELNSPSVWLFATSWNFKSLDLMAKIALSLLILYLWSRDIVLLMLNMIHYYPVLLN